jgi:hypothetical protein
MARTHRQEERFAEEVLRRVLGAVVTAHDDTSRPRMVDALFVLPDGREGALEVTTIGDQDALQLEALAAKGDWTVPGGRWAWVVCVGAGVSMRKLAEHLPELVLTCERLGIPSPELVAGDEGRAPAFRWVESCDVRIHGFPETSRPGAVDVLPNSSGGAVYEHLDELPEWLEHRLGEADLVSNLEKLAATGRPERHLFLRVHDTALPFSLYYPLAWGDYIPARELLVTFGLTGLWLAPAWKNPLLWWGAATGWQRADCLD